MRTRRAWGWAAVAIVLALGTGAKEHKLVDRWVDPQAIGERFHKILVIAITDDQEARHVFEDRFVSHLRGKNIDGVTSHSMVADLATVSEMDRQAILDAIEEQGIDGAISVRAVPLAGTTEEAWAEAWSAEVHGKGTLRQLIEESLPVPKKKSGKYGVEATLWDANGWDRAWAGRTNPYTRDEMKEGAADFVQFVMFALEVDDLIKGTDPYPH